MERSLRNADLRFNTTLRWERTGGSQERTRLSTRVMVTAARPSISPGLPSRTPVTPAARGGERARR